MGKKTRWLRAAALTAALAMLGGMMTACDTKKGPETDPYSSVAEVGTEAELTAVRDNLIKATETKGLGEIEKMEFYENGVRTASDEYVMVKDNKKIYWSGDIKRVVNYPDGYMLDIPQDWVPDYSLSTLRSRYDTEEVSLIVTHEEGMIGSYYTDGAEYLDAMYVYVGDPTWQKNNRVTELAPRTVAEFGDGWKIHTYRLKLNDCPEGVKCYYTYVDIYDDVKEAYHFMFKAVDDRDFSSVYNSFVHFYDKGSPVDTVLYPCESNPNWCEETAAYYEEARRRTTVDWGIFSANLQTNGWKVTIPIIEKKIDYKFPIISEYRHFILGNKPHDFPSEFCDKVEADGRMMQMTYQYTANNNTDLSGYSPSLDIYRRDEDAMQILRDFATGAAEFDRPFFFRLNNEMSTNWTSYCALCNMLDPDIFIDTWIALYDLFTETGANEYAMWVFNSQDKSYPPMKWANYRNYMPQANYIDWIGLTAYNFGDDYNWSSFESMYDYVNQEYQPYFSEWPWIISEFGCSDASELEENEGRKAQWVTDMFTVLNEGKYPNIKVAVWFNANDYDNAGNVVHEIVLQTDQKVLAAFKEGLELTQP